MKLPIAPKPVGEYKAVMIRNNLGFVSGQFPLENGQLLYSGRIGKELSYAQALKAMELTAYNVLAQISEATNHFKNLGGLLRLEGHLACMKSFNQQIDVLNVASKIFNQHLGEKGHHSRTLFTHEKLPLNSPIELCVNFSLHINPTTGKQ